MADVGVTIEFELELQTDPLGATLDIAVPSAPSDATRQALLDSVEQTMVGARGNLVFQSVQRVHEAIDGYAASNSYDLNFFSETFSGVDYQRDRTSIRIKWSWAGDLPMFYEFGVSRTPSRATHCSTSTGKKSTSGSRRTRSNGVAKQAVSQSPAPFAIVSTGCDGRSVKRD